MWIWIRRIAALKSKKIKWVDHPDDPNSAIFILTVNGTNFRTWEPKHPTLPVSRAHCSHKYKHAALRYGIALSIFTGQCVWVSDAYPGGVHDMQIFCDGLKKKIPDGKLVIADRGYRSSQDDEKMMSTPNMKDDPLTSNFKSRARCRQESFNGRLKNFAILRDTYRHNLDKHRYVLEAIVVIVQVQMNNGSPLFEV